MNKKYLLTATLAVIVFAGYAQPVKIKKVFADAGKQMTLMLAEIPAAKQGHADWVSPRTLEKGSLRMVPSRDWTSGFFPGILWMLYEYSGKASWKEQAIHYTKQLEQEKWNRGTHDMGFKLYCSYGLGYRLTGDTQMRAVLLQAARTLSTRFNPTAGVIRSWDHNRDKWDYPVIIDNMLNLELLFAATQLSGDSSFYRIAVSHANTTLRNHFRPDYSSYHVVSYDTITGAPVKKNTHQGYADASAWARGQAWGIYGYTMCYRFTKDTAYLQQARHIADFMLKHPRMPADGVPYWDYDAPNIPNEERDASAAAVLASGLYELSGYLANGKYYRKQADHIMRSLTQKYRAPLGTASGFILLHSTGSKPAKSEVDVPLIYADYYYLEALLRSRAK
ncbi:MAG: glycoside hydrolase family 88 protein [Sphingobacteriales bacterium]|nr:glycoside hydrolase family 88 protein [Sphingobacteriales bacterium]OJW33252.1 MAG: glucuronyl hydrolase [Sphingobacteriales bacterium 46-32]